MRKLLYMLMLISGIGTAQTFNFECASDDYTLPSNIYNQSSESIFFGDVEFKQLRYTDDGTQETVLYGNRSKGIGMRFEKSGTDIGNTLYSYSLFLHRVNAYDDALVSNTGFAPYRTFVTYSTIVQQNEALVRIQSNDVEGDFIDHINNRKYIFGSPGEYPLNTNANFSLHGHDFEFRGHDPNSNRWEYYSQSLDLAILSQLDKSDGEYDIKIKCGTEGGGYFSTPSDNNPAVIGVGGDDEIEESNVFFYLLTRLFLDMEYNTIYNLKHGETSPCQ